jgi:hypothetical protein
MFATAMIFALKAVLLRAPSATTAARLSDSFDQVPLQAASAERRLPPWQGIPCPQTHATIAREVVSCKCLQGRAPSVLAAGDSCASNRLIWGAFCDQENGPQQVGWALRHSEASFM